MHIMKYKKLVLPTLLILALFSVAVTAGDPTFTFLNPVANQGVGFGTLFQIDNSSGMNRTIDVKFYIDNVLFAQVENSTTSVGSFLLSEFNTTNATADYSDGLHTLTVIINMTDDNVGTQPTVGYTNSTSIEFFVDETIPTVDIEFKDDKLVEIFSPFNFQYGDAVNIDCNPKDTGTGVQNLTISVKGPDQQTSGVVSTAINGEYKYATTETLGTYTVTCAVFDDAFGNVSASKKFIVIEKPPRSTSAFSNPSFVAPVGKKKVSAGSVNDAGVLTTEGVSRLVQAEGTVVLSVKGDSHEFEVVEVTDEEVTIMVTSEPIEVTIAEGETTSVDLDRDGTNDVAVTFHKRFPPGGRYADLTFALTEGAATPVAEEDTGKEATTPSETTEPTISTSNAGLWITIIVIIVIIFIGYTMIKGKKR